MQRARGAGRESLLAVPEAARAGCEDEEAKGVRWVKIFWLRQLTNELDQGWRLELLPPAREELSGALGQSLSRRDGIRGGG